MNDFTSFFADIWRLFQEVNVPILNISFADMWLGIFVVGVSIMILRPLLGIGGTGFGNNIMHGLRGVSKRSGDSGYKPKQPEYGTKVIARNNNVSRTYTPKDKIKWSK